MQFWLKLKVANLCFHCLTKMSPVVKLCNWCELYAHENVVFNYMVDLVP